EPLLADAHVLGETAEPFLLYADGLELDAHTTLALLGSPIGHAGIIGRRASRDGRRRRRRDVRVAAEPAFRPHRGREPAEEPELREVLLGERERPHRRDDETGPYDGCETRRSQGVAHALAEPHEREPEVGEE